VDGPGTVSDAAAADVVQPRDLGSFERSLPPPPPSGHGWTLTDVGDVGANKAAFAVSTGLIGVRGGGAGLGETSDAFGFAYKKIKGDADLVARVRSLQMIDPASTAGIMLRADATDPGAAMVFLGLLGDATKGGQLVSRARKGAASQLSAPDAAIRPGQFLRIRREGRRFTLYRSVDRTAWIKLGATEADMPEEIAVGLATTSHSAASVAAAEYDFVRLVSGDGLAQGFDLEIITGVGQSAALEGKELTFTGIGDVFNTTTEFGSAVLRPVSGSQTIIAKIEGFNPDAPAARVALTFREGGPARVSPTARHVLISVTAAGLVQFQKRDAMTNFEGGKMAMGMKPPLWLKLVRVDDPATAKTRVTGLYSTDGSAWTELDAMNIPLSDPVLGGMMLTSGSASVFATARVTEFSMGAGLPAAPMDAGDNAPPPADAAASPADAALPPPPDAGPEASPPDLGTDQAAPADDGAADAV
jgi:hypothetical protein